MMAQVLFSIYFVEKVPHFNAIEYTLVLVNELEFDDDNSSNQNSLVSVITSKTNIVIHHEIFLKEIFSFTQDYDNRELPHMYWPPYSIKIHLNINLLLLLPDLPLSCSQKLQGLSLNF